MNLNSKINIVINTLTNLIVPIITFIVCVLEALIYPGYVLTYLHIDLGTFVSASTYLILLQISGNTNLWRLLIKINRILILPFSLILTTILFAFEFKFRVGYSFERYRVNPELFLYFVFFSLAIHLIGIIDQKYHSKIKKKIWVSGLIIIYFWAVTRSLYYGSWFLVGYVNQATNMQTNNSQQFINTWPNLYPLTSLIDEVTPKNSTILQPPQINPWQEEGNQLLLRYFLYPRKIYQTKTYENYYDNLVLSDYLIITNGNQGYYPTRDSGYWPLLPTAYDYIVTVNDLKAEVSLKKLEFSKNSIHWIKQETTDNRVHLSDNNPIKQEIYLGELDTVNRFVRFEYLSSHRYGTRLLIKLAEKSNLDYHYIYPKKFEVEEVDGSYKYKISTDINEISTLIAKNSIASSFKLYIEVTNSRPLLFLYERGVAKRTTKIGQNEQSESNIGDYYYSIRDFNNALIHYHNSLNKDKNDLRALYGIYAISLQSSSNKITEDTEERLIKGIELYTDQNQAIKIIDELKNIYANDH